MEAHECKGPCCSHPDLPGPPPSPLTGACEVLCGALEGVALRHLDLSQNHVRDELPQLHCRVTQPRNTCLTRLDLGFNWIQVGGEGADGQVGGWMAGWIAG